MLFCVWFLLALLETSQSITWLAFRHVEPPSWDSTNLCGMLGRHHGFVGRQEKLCRRYRDVMRHVHTACTETMNTCQRLFATQRWNCSSVTFAPNYMRDLTAGTREQAFVYAHSSAALVHSVARACSSGTIFHCGCGLVPKLAPDGDFKWGGCADNVRFGLRFARSFADAKDRKKLRRKNGRMEHGKLQAKVNLHNNRAGRKIAQKSLAIHCKCHGVSGSCNLKTCWRALPSVLSIAERIHYKYRHSSSEVQLRRLGSRWKLAPADHAVGRFGRQDLVYNAKSPDYCLRDENFGSLGTSGRECNASSASHDGCKSMCCGRPYRTFTEERIHRCHCKYIWCCEVKCKTCRTWVDVHECT